MKKILVLLGVFLGLLGFVYFDQIEGEKAREEAKQLEDAVFKGLKIDQVTSIEVVVPDQDALRLSRISAAGPAPDPGPEEDFKPQKKAQWRLESPLAAKADSGAVHFLLQRLEEAKIDRLLEGKGDSLSDYGLDNPQLSLTVEAGDQEYKLRIGQQGFGGNRVYAQLDGSSDVYLMTKSLYTQAAKPLEDWRDKDLLEFESTLVRAVEVDRPSGGLRFSKQDDRWKLEEPLQEDADQQNTSAILSSLDLAKVSEFAPDPEDLSAYGLDQPVVRLRIREEDEQEWKSVEVGAQREDGKYWARDLSRPEVFAIDAELHEKLTRELWDFRGKQLINLPQDQISQVSVRREQGEVTVERKDFTWTIQSPEDHEGEETYSYKFWYPLENIKFTSLDDADASFPESSAEVTVTLEDGSTHRYQFARQGESCRAKNLQTGRQGQISQEDCEKPDFKIEEMVG